MKREIHQILPSLEEGDAIGDYARRLRNLLRKEGFASEIFVFRRRPGQAGCFPLSQHRARPGSGLVFHTAIGSPLAAYFAAARARKVLVHHNITPAACFAGHEPEDGWLAFLARRQLGQLAGKVDAAVADSDFNARELESLGYPPAKVIPLPFDWEKLGAEPDRETLNRLEDGKNNILFVGRVAPNKGQDELVEVFGLYRELFHPSSRLILAGEKEHYGSYAAQIERAIRRRGLEDAVEMPGKVSASVLRAFYRSAHLFFCLSRHEGFGVPLVESLFYRVPVLAREAGAVADTLGGAGLVVGAAGTAELAALVHLLLTDSSRREKILIAQDSRLEWFRRFPFRQAWLEVLASLWE